jgi:hypothetical protein
VEEEPVVVAPVPDPVLAEIDDEEDSDHDSSEDDGESSEPRGKVLPLCAFSRLLPFSPFLAPRTSNSRWN